MNTRDILAKLIAFPTISRDPNVALIQYVSDLLHSHGARVTLLENEDGTKANLYASTGSGDGGVMLSGHTDVVPIDGQSWTKPAFELTQDQDRLYGRGTADMKGFCASAIAAFAHACAQDLKTPLHLALSYDEEIGCIGVRSLVDMLAAAPARPDFAIIGEPTDLAIATGHKGKTALKAEFKGAEGHSALAPLALNALHLAIDFAQEIRAEQARITAAAARDGDYDIPYTTLHIGAIRGGVALNIVPNHAELDFEIRNLAQDDPDDILSRLTAQANDIVAQTHHPKAAIEISETFSYPGLATPPDAEIVALMKSITGANGTRKVAFGTEAGLFSRDAGIPSIVCGPGSMMQGHKPDEYVTIDQLERCDIMLANLIERLSQGL